LLSDFDSVYFLGASVGDLVGDLVGALVGDLVGAAVIIISLGALGPVGDMRKTKGLGITKRDNSERIPTSYRQKQIQALWPTHHHHLKFLGSGCREEQQKNSGGKFHGAVRVGASSRQFGDASVFL
jgi:hypothetical protein